MSDFLKRMPSRRTQYVFLLTRPPRSSPRSSRDTLCAARSVSRPRPSSAYPPMRPTAARCSGGPSFTVPPPRRCVRLPRLLAPCGTCFSRRRTTRASLYRSIRLQKSPWRTAKVRWSSLMCSLLRVSTAGWRAKAAARRMRVVPLTRVHRCVTYNTIDS